MAWKLHAIDQMQLRRQHRGNGVGRPKFDLHTGYGEPGATTIIQRSYDDVVHTPRRLSIDGDDPLEGDDGVWGQYLELDETESAQRVPALIVVPYLSPPIDIAPTSPTTRRSSNF